MGKRRKVCRVCFGAIQKAIYLELIQQNGFKNISIQKEKVINIPCMNSVWGIENFIKELTIQI